MCVCVCGGEVVNNCFTLTATPFRMTKAGLDAPHLGVGIAAGEAAAYEVYKDIMDIVIEGWHGYKPTDSHK